MKAAMVMARGSGKTRLPLLAMVTSIEVAKGFGWQKIEALPVMFQ
jgi:hypothetical protein